MDRAAAAKIGGMDRQTLRDWVHRFNVSGPEGLIDKRTEGPKPRRSEQPLAQLAKIVEAGPDREKDGVVRWRRIDLKRVIAERFGVDFHPRYVGKLLKKLGFSHISARPRHRLRTSGSSRRLKNFPRALKAHLDGISETTPVEIWFQDVSRQARDESPKARRTASSASGPRRGTRPL